MSFIHDNFLLETSQAERLYHEFAVEQPILDYHNHLSPREIAENRQFRNLTEIWLEGDHYKWRAMRANGVAEELCTGSAEPVEKFRAWARTVPHTLRNPLYHWTHLELARYFGITELLDDSTADRVWEKANAQLACDGMRAQGILRKFGVKALCTTDDPADDLAFHQQVAREPFGVKVFPAFRPDKALAVQHPEMFTAWLKRLEQAVDREIRVFADLLDALEKRHEFFHQHGCRLSDHGLNQALSDPCSESDAARIFRRAQTGLAASAEEARQYGSYLMLFFGRLDAKRGWTKQLHLGARRNNNQRLLARCGPDTGFDSIGDWPQIDAVGQYLDLLDRENALPKMILYNLNPADNYAFATMVGNFQGGSVAGKIQHGSGWWFLDQKEAMEWQMNALSNCGLLSKFVGMLTDSRSFMSFPRHEYFRRVLCNLLGHDMARGLVPADFALVGGMIRNICYGNAAEFLGLALD
jgi:glucuronate isomerase